MSSSQPPPIPPHGTRKQQANWNSDQTDLSCHRLTPEQLAQKLMSRQSHNVALARATLLSAGAQSSQPLTPALAARLRAATEQSLESVIAECNAAVSSSQRIRQVAINPNADPTIPENDEETLANNLERLICEDSTPHIPSSAASVTDVNNILNDPNAKDHNLAHLQQVGDRNEELPDNCSSAEAPADAPSSVRSSSAPTYSPQSFIPSMSSANTKIGGNKLPLITTNGSSTSTYSSISNILRAKHGRSQSHERKSTGSHLSELLHRKSTASPGGSSSDSSTKEGNGGDTLSGRNSAGILTGAGGSTAASSIAASMSGGIASNLASLIASTSGTGSTTTTTANGGSAVFQYTKDLEEARLEHEKELQRLKEDCEVDSPPVESLDDVLKMTQAPPPPQQTRNLDKTLQLVVSTCEALWAQLQQERHTRQQLQDHLQRQGAVIGDLTSELLQIQEQQEDILQEVQLARSSLLWQLAAGDEGEGRAGEDPRMMGEPGRIMGEAGRIMGDDGRIIGDAGPILGPSSMLAAAMAENEGRRLSSSAPPSFYEGQAGGRPMLPPALYPAASAFSAFPGGAAGRGGGGPAAAGVRPPLLFGRRGPQASHSLQNSPKHANFNHPGAGFS